MAESNRTIKTSILKHDGGIWEYATLGSGEPTIVLEAGLGDGLQAWSPIVDDLQHAARVFCYNRAGYGKSRSPHKDRTGQVIADELHALLHAVHYQPPFMLVGHSFGGACVEIFAHRYPEEVSGLVLIDPGTIEMEELCKQEGIKEWNLSLFSRVMISLLLSRGMNRERRRLEESLLQTRIAPVSEHSFPVVVLTADKCMWTPRLQDAWLRSHAALVQRHSNCRHVVLDCGHYIQKDQPRAVVDQILAIVNDVSQGTNRDRPPECGG